MPIWTVLLRVPSGIHAEAVEADVAEYSDDGLQLRFNSLGPLIDAAKTLADAENSPPETPAQAEQVLRTLLDLLGRVQVASFPKADVAGYYRGERRQVTLTVNTPGPKLP